jgi:hypothetical protein
MQRIKQMASAGVTDHLLNRTEQLHSPPTVSQLARVTRRCGIKMQIETFT